MKVKSVMDAFKAMSKTGSVSEDGKGSPELDKKLEELWNSELGNMTNSTLNSYNGLKAKIQKQFAAELKESDLIRHNPCEEIIHMIRLFMEDKKRTDVVKTVAEVMKGANEFQVATVNALYNRVIGLDA